MKQKIYNCNSLYIRKHLSKEGPRETFVVHHGKTARIFAGAAGVINFLNGKISESHLMSVEDWLNDIDTTDAA